MTKKVSLKLSGFDSVRLWVCSRVYEELENYLDIMGGILNYLRQCAEQYNNYC